MQGSCAICSKFYLFNILLQNKKHSIDQVTPVFDILTGVITLADAPTCYLHIFHYFADKSKRSTGVSYVYYCAFIFFILFSILLSLYLRL